jgi:uncharacterized protein YndB with AHSA1/START domain
MSENNLVVDRETLSFTMSRIFDAPREAIWRVSTDPELIPQWWGPSYLTTVVDKMDFRVGGEWRYIQTDKQGNEHAFNGVYKEIVAPERVSYTFEYEPMAGHISVDTLTLEELSDGRTKMTSRTTMDNLEDLEGMLQSGMEGGAVETWDRLEALAKETAGEGALSGS